MMQPKQQQQQQQQQHSFWNIFSNMVAGEVYDRMKIL